MVKIAVIGTGNMGFNHIRVLTGMEGVDKVIICDADKQKLETVAKRFNLTSTYTDYKEMLQKEKPDGVVIATPSSTHKKVVFDILPHNTAILCEKPIADTVEDAEAIAQEVKKTNAKLMVGHIERFNPVVAKIKELIEQKVLGSPYYVQTKRNGPFPKRLYGLKTGVLLDLAVHDIDIIEYLTAPIEQVYSQLMSEKEQEIHANVLLNIQGGIHGACEFSWISPKRIRTIEIYGTKGILTGDYQSQEVWFYENAEGNAIPVQEYDFKRIALGSNISEGKVIKYPVKMEEPLVLELQELINVIKGKEPAVDAKAGVRSVKISTAIYKANIEQKPIATK